MTAMRSHRSATYVIPGTPHWHPRVVPSPHRGLPRLLIAVDVIHRTHAMTAMDSGCLTPPILRCTSMRGTQASIRRYCAGAVTPWQTAASVIRSSLSVRGATGTTIHGRSGIRCGDILIPAVAAAISRTRPFATRATSASLATRAYPVRDLTVHPVSQSARRRPHLRYNGSSYRA